MQQNASYKIEEDSYVCTECWENYFLTKKKRLIGLNFLLAKSGFMRHAQCTFRIAIHAKKKPEKIATYVQGLEWYLSNIIWHLTHTMWERWPVPNFHFLLIIIFNYSPNQKVLL